MQIVLLGGTGLSYELDFYNPGGGKRCDLQVGIWSNSQDIKDEASNNFDTTMHSCNWETDYFVDQT